MARVPVRNTLAPRTRSAVQAMFSAPFASSFLTSRYHLILVSMSQLPRHSPIFSSTLALDHPKRGLNAHKQTYREITNQIL